MMYIIDDVIFWYTLYHSFPEFKGILEGLGTSKPREPRQVSREAQPEPDPIPGQLISPKGASGRGGLRVRV